MSVSGIRVELSVGDPGHCPVTEAAREADGRATDLARTVEDGTVVHEFTVLGDGGSDAIPDDGDPGTGADGSGVSSGDLEPVFEWSEGTRYRHRGDHDSLCVCRTLGEYGYAVADVTTGGESLTLAFYVESVDALEDVVAVLRSRFYDVTVDGLERDCDLDGRDAVTVDRARLTDRQREVLRTAFEMGYFETPKRANASDVAAELDLALSTTTEHLAAAEHAVFSMLLETE